MLTLLMFTLTLGVNAMVSFDDVEDECIDKSPYCTANDCKVRPGYALEYCKKTCGNCEPFCFNSFIISCKESRKQECDSMLKDYCPLLCGACRAKKKNTSKRKGNRLMSNNPASVAKLGILQKFSSPNLPISNHLLHNASSVPIMPTATVPPASAEGSSSPTAIFEPATEEEDLNPLPFSDTNSLGSSPIVIEEDEKEVHNLDSEGYLGLLPGLDVAASANNEVFAPEPVRITLKPPWRRRGPQEHFSKFPHSLGRPSMPTLPIKASKKFHPSPPPPRWLLPHQGLPQPYPVTQSAFFLNSYSQDVYGHPVHHLESPEEAPLSLGELIALLGCRDTDPSICSKVTNESCLSRPGYYSKLCPVKCRNCNGLQCLDSVKISCSKVQRLGGCKLPMAAEYCPKTCRRCTLPARIAEGLPPCKDELDTCENLAASGVCDHPYSRKALRTYCAKSCGHCRESQYYMNDAMYRRMPIKRQRQKKPTKMPFG